MDSREQRFLLNVICGEYLSFEVNDEFDTGYTATTCVVPLGKLENLFSPLKGARERVRRGFLEP